MATMKTTDASTILKLSELSGVYCFGNDDVYGGLLVGSEKESPGSKFTTKGIKKATLSTVEARWPFYYQMPSDGYHPAEGADIGTQGVMKGVECKLGLKAVVVPTEISTFARLTGKFIGEDELTMLKGMIMAQESIWQYMVLHDMWGDGSGVLERVREEQAVGASDVTVTLKLLQVHWLLGRRGARVDVYNSLTGSKILDSWEIGAIDLDEETVVLTGTAVGGAGVTVNHGAYLVMNDDLNAQPGGMAAAFSDGAEISDNAALPQLFWFANGTATYANQSGATYDRHNSYVQRLDALAGAGQDGKLQPWNEHNLIYGAKRSRQMAAKNAPKIDTILMDKATAQYFFEEAKTSPQVVVNVPPGGDPVAVKYGWPAEAWIVDNVYKDGAARILVDEHMPRFCVMQTALGDHQIRWTNTPTYFGEKLESLANSGNKLVEASKFGSHLTPVFQHRAAHTIMTHCKAHTDHLPKWLREKLAV